MHDLGDFEDSAENDDIESLRDNSKTTMMNIVYNAVIEGEDKAIKSESPVEEKYERWTRSIVILCRKGECGGQLGGMLCG